MKRARLCALSLGLLVLVGGPGWSEKRVRPLAPIPDKLVVLSFDDCNKSDRTFVAEELKKHGFGATFFITSGWLRGDRRLDWEGVKKLEDAGFEIGCHTATHPNILPLSDEEVRKQIAVFERACSEHGIGKATSFSISASVGFQRATIGPT